MEKEDNDTENAAAVVVVNKVAAVPAPTPDEIQNQTTDTKKLPHSRSTRQT